MKLYALFLAIILFSFPLFPFAQGEIPTMNSEEMNDFIAESKKEGKLHIINFWATWCSPCVKELPYFEEANREHGDEINVILVSLDIPSHKKSKLPTFIKEKNLKSKVVHLDPDEAPKWIEEYLPQWGGSIPATLFIKGEEQEFYPRALDRAELFRVLNKMK